MTELPAIDVTLEELETLGRVLIGCIDDPASAHRVWCGLRTEDGLYCSGRGQTDAEAAFECLRAARQLVC